MVSESSEFEKLLKGMTEQELQLFLSTLTDIEVEQLYYDLEWQGRSKQQIPLGDWIVWILKSGRGFGKTWLGGKLTNKWARTTSQIALVGDNIGEVRDVMIDGESGIRATAHPSFIPEWNKTLCQLTYPNGAKVFGFSAQEPPSLRGPNNGKAWVDELFKFRYQQELWDELMMTMRSGANPQTLVTSTPRPTALCKELVAAPNTIVTSGSTHENTNLSPVFLNKIISKYEGTRRGRQELYGEILEDNPGALFKLTDIEPFRVKSFLKDGDEMIQLLSTMDRVVVGVDPAVSNNDNSDETGIVVCARKGDEGYVFADESKRGSPNEWAEQVVESFETYEGDKVVAEVNQGGDLVEATIKNVNEMIPVKKVRATRGKAIRAEPIAQLYEQHRIHHVGYFGELEDQMLNFNPSLGRNQKSPDRMDALVWAMTELFGETVRTPQVFVV